MQFLILGLALLVLVLLAGRALVRANPKLLAKNIRKLGGWSAIIVAMVLMATGRMMLGLPLALFGYSLLNRSFSWRNPLGSADKSSGQTSSVRTEMLEMTLDHDSGDMDGMVRQGEFAGRRLSAMSGGRVGDTARRGAAARHPGGAIDRGIHPAQAGRPDRPPAIGRRGEFACHDAR